MPVISIYNPHFKGAEQIYVCDTPEDLQALYDSIELDTLAITDTKETPTSDKKITHYALTLTNTDKTIQLSLSTYKEWNNINTNKPFFYTNILIRP